MEGIVFQLLAKLGELAKKDQGVVLTPGDIVSVYVKQLMGNQALLRYQNQLILAQLETAVQEGAKVRCLVQGERDGRVLLKLLPDGEPGSGSSANVTTALLKSMGVTESAINKQLVEAMLRQEITVTREKFDTITQMLQKQKIPITRDTLDLLVFLEKQGIPVEKSRVETLLTSLKDSASLGRQLADIRSLLTNLRHPAAGSEIALANSNPKVLPLADQILSVLDKITVKPGEARQVLGGKIVFSLLATDPQNPVPQSQTLQNQIARNQTLQNQTSLNQTPQNQITQNQITQNQTPQNQITQNPVPQNQAPPNQITQNLVAPNTDPPLSQQPGPPVSNSEQPQRVFETENRLVQRFVKLVLDQSDHVIPQKSQLLEGIQKTIEGYRSILTEEPQGKLPEMLSRLHEMIREESNPVFKELSAKLAGIAEKMMIFQQINKGAEPGPENLYIFQSLANPANPDGVYELLVRVKKESSGGTVNWTDCQIVVSLNTANLGLVKSHLRLAKKTLQCRFIVEREEFRGMVDARVSMLKERLEFLGFVVKVTPTEVVSDDKPAVSQLFEISTGLPKVNRLDVHI